MKIEENYSLLHHNTFGLDVKTQWFVEYYSERELIKLLNDEYFLSLPYLHIGEGSNLLFLGDYDGVILHSGIKDVEIIKEDHQSVYIKAGSGISWDTFVTSCVENGWGGIENLSLIPGEVGASAVQNIGAYGSEVCDSIVEVYAYDVETKKKRIFSNEDCHFAYRQSIFKKKYKGKFIICYVVFRLSKQPVYNIEYGNLREVLAQKGEINLQNIRDAIISIRKSKLPDFREFGNAGSYFMNPYIDCAKYTILKKDYPEIPGFPISKDQVKIPAAWLIDQCGLKGKTLHNVAVHDKQPLVLINKGGATGTEVALLAEEVKKAVLDKFEIVLDPEVYYV